MKTKTMTNLLRLVLIAAAALCGVFFFLCLPSYGQEIVQADPEFAWAYWPCLVWAWLFALPICAGNILQLLYSTVDTLVIGNFCDTTALASVATSSQPLEILLCVFVGIGSGISILVSQAVGRADHDQLQKLVRTSVWLLFAASLPLTVIGFLLGPWMLRLMQVPADAMPGAVLYLRITMLGILGNMGYNFNAGLLRGIGNSSSSLLLLFISCAANIVLDLVLTGALGLGIGGVAAATAIALFLSWICSIFYIRRRCTELALPVLPCGFDAGALRQIVRIGLPLGLNSALYSIGHIFLQVLYNLQGSVFVAGCSVAGKVGGLANITVTSLSQATSVFAGQNLGAQSYSRLRRGGWLLPRDVHVAVDERQQIAPVRARRVAQIDHGDVVAVVFFRDRAVIS